VDPVEQAAAWSEALEGRGPQEVIRWSVATFGKGLAVGSSFGRDGLVVIDIARRWLPKIPVLFLETGCHFPETLRFRDEVAARWGLNVVDVRPALTVEEQAARFGGELWSRDPDACCQLRKVEPLRRALQGYSAWMTGLRRDQHAGRSKTPIVEWQQLAPDRGVFKINPMVGWSRPDVDAYVADHELPRHPLWDRGYASVGCAPCTVPVAPGGSERSGRWASSGKSECGIHLFGIRSAASPTPP
jgi:phosphoadenosine phosphosulfate reductase